LGFYSYKEESGLNFREEVYFRKQMYPYFSPCHINRERGRREVEEAKREVVSLLKDSQ
jgi:hypothetical protein